MRRFSTLLVPVYCSSESRTGTILTVVRLCQSMMDQEKLGGKRRNYSWNSYIEIDVCLSNIPIFQIAMELSVN